MTLPNIKIDERVLEKLARQYKIHELGIFGSVLREDFSDESDIDIIVEFEQDTEYSLFDIMKIKEEFETLFGKEIDLIEKNGLRNPYRRESILNSMKVIYAA